MVSIRDPPDWGVEPVRPTDRLLGGIDDFVLWSSLGVGLLVFSAGSFLSGTRFYDAIIAIIVGSITGSTLLALAGKIGSDHAVPALISIRPSFGVKGAYLPAALNVMQLVGWTIFEIMIMSKAAEMLVGKLIAYYIWVVIIGSFTVLLGIIGPLAVIRKWLGKFAVWISYASSIIIIVHLLTAGNFSRILLSTSNGMSFFSALDIVIAIPISWLPLLADEADNAFADVYSAAVSTQSIFRKIKQRYLIIGFVALSIFLAITVSIE